MRRGLLGAALLGAALLALGWVSTAQAHDADVATFVLRPVVAESGGVKARGWTLDVHVARHALDAALGDPGEAADPKGWRARAVAYAKAHIRLTLGGEVLKLGGGGIRVGGHQTDLRFLVADLPAAGGALSVRIDAFTEDGHQSNVLKLRGAAARTVVLSAGNDYAAEVKAAR